MTREAYPIRRYRLAILLDDLRKRQGIRVIEPQHKDHSLQQTPSAMVEVRIHQFGLHNFKAGVHMVHACQCYVSLSQCSLVLV